MQIPLIKPYITEKTIRRVCEVLDSGFLTEGSVTHHFEDVVSRYIGCSHTLAVCNCTVGLEMALRALGIGPGDEVIVPDYTYPATASVVNIVGARAKIVDIDPETMLIDYGVLERAITSQTRAVIPVSLFGNPLDYDRLNTIKAKSGLYIIEDAACSLGAQFKGQKVGTLADISVFSLHPRKFITTGEGGLVTTATPGWADWMDSYKHFGIDGTSTRLCAQFKRIGTNYKLSDVLAAIGVAQMGDIDLLLTGRRRLAERYRTLLVDTHGISLPKTTEGGVHSWQTFCVFVNDRDTVMQQLRDRGIEAQIGTYSLHMHKAFWDNDRVRIDGSMDGSRYAFEHALALPLFYDMDSDRQMRVVDELKALMGDR